MTDSLRDVVARALTGHERHGWGVCGCGWMTDATVPGDPDPHDMHRIDIALAVFADWLDRDDLRAEMVEAGNLAAHGGSLWGPHVDADCPIGRGMPVTVVATLGVLHRRIEGDE